MTVVLLIAGLALLVAGGELLVRGASKLALALGISPLVVGLTVVAFGTSSPELAVSIQAVAAGNVDIALGNVVGSNVMNVAFILGLTALFRPIPLPSAIVRGEVWIALACAFVPFLALTADGRLTRGHGIALLVGLVVFLLRGWRNGRRDSANAAEMSAFLADPPVAAPHASIGLVPAILLIAVGLTMLVIGGDTLVDASVEIARSLGVTELVIGLTIVAAGTSAPELVTSIIAAVRGHQDLAVGNVLGSNVFNMLAIVGTTSLVTPQAVSDELLARDVPMLIAVSIVLLPMVTLGRVPRLGGALFVCGYVAYVVWRIGP